MTLPTKTWHVDEIHWQSAGRPTHITIRLDDPTLYPAFEEFAQHEGLKLIPSELGKRNEVWIDYPREDFEQAKLRIEQWITNLYWKHKRAEVSQFKIGDGVEIVEVLKFRPGQQPIFVQMNDEGIIEEIIGFDLYVVAFKNSGTISDVPGESLRGI